MERISIESRKTKATLVTVADQNTGLGTGTKPMQSQVSFDAHSKIAPMHVKSVFNSIYLPCKFNSFILVH